MHCVCRNSEGCTLILTEGDSAKSLAVAGISVVGRDKYGVFPLKGKMLNVREASHKQVGTCNNELGPESYISIIFIAQSVNVTTGRHMESYWSNC